MPSIYDPKYNFVDLSDLEPSVDNFATRAEQYQEALARLRFLEDCGLQKGVVADFEKGVDAMNSRHYSFTHKSRNVAFDGSKYISIIGLLFWIDNENEEASAIKGAVDRVESENQGLVYHAIRCTKQFGEMAYLLFIDKYKNGWERQREDLSDGLVFVWAENFTVPEFSEFGTVQIGIAGGGLVLLDTFPSIFNTTERTMDVNMPLF